MVRRVPRNPLLINVHYATVIIGFTAYYRKTTSKSVHDFRVKNDLFI